ncbi:transmembrane protein 214-like [Chrysemys picta bellii]|uniref:transmembrane protein 214-like n=1 Tax=Chrysemys picta bellii TaxID=8478 RepID=UPI0032B12042
MASVGPAGAGRWELVRRGRGRRPAGGAAGRRALQEANSGRLLPSASPITTSDTIFELGFEKTGKKQNKEQVPPAPAPEQHHKKQNMGKNAKKSTAVDAGLKQGKFRTLEDALKAVSFIPPITEAEGRGEQYISSQEFIDGPAHLNSSW